VSQPPYVPERPRNLGPGIAELLADPAHYRRHPMQVVDYGEQEERLPEPLLTRRSLLRRLLGRKS
jgi:hypothetical protein